MHFAEVLVIAALLSIYGSADGQVISVGGCPDMSVVDNFEPNKYTGRWYEAERVFNPFEVGGSCITGDYTIEEDNFNHPTGNLLVVHSMTNWLGRKISKSADAFPLDRSSRKAKYLLKYKGSPFTGPYWILDTDYDTYSVVYSCTSVLGLLSFKYVWLLTRLPQAPKYTIDNMESVLKKNNLSSILLIKTYQKNCKYT
uniref:Apolipoprotein D n=1 Tax=Nilaparvata lugens TaxID=108931 RepID=A0A1I9WL92_NILLU|nr:seminal fluid protein [Nilaparvata lugens]